MVWEKADGTNLDSVGVMKMFEDHYLRYVSSAVFLTSFIFFILSFSTPWWIEFDFYFDTRNYHQSTGLWQRCSKSDWSDKWECFASDLTETGTKFCVTQAFMCLSLLAKLGAMGSFIYWIYKKQDGTLSYVAAGNTFVGGLFNLIAVCVFGSIYDTGTLAWSFWLGCVSVVLGTLNGVVTAVVLFLTRD